MMNTSDAGQSVTPSPRNAERMVCALLATGLTWMSFSPSGGLFSRVDSQGTGESKRADAADLGLRLMRSGPDGTAARAIAIPEVARGPSGIPTVIVTGHRISQQGPARLAGR